MNQPALDLEPTLSPSSPVVSAKSDQLPYTEVQRLIYEGNQMDSRVFQNNDISLRGAGFGRGYTGQIKDAIKDLRTLDSQMLATEEGQRVVIAAAEQLFAERSFSPADMAKVQLLLRLATVAMLPSNEITELKEVTLATLEDRLKRPSELARKYNAHQISREEMSRMMAASYDWMGGGLKGAGALVDDQITPEVKAARSRAEAQRRYLSDMKAGFESIEIGSLQDEQKEKLAGDVTKLLGMLEDQSNLIRRSKWKEQEIEESDVAKIEYVKHQIEQIMAQAQADGVTMDTSIITDFAQPGSLSAYQSVQEILAVVRNFKAALLGKDSSEVDVGLLGIGISSLSTVIPVDEKV
jgi:hypothetical protein